MNKAQKEMTCPRCSEFCVFHKEIEYEVEEQKYPCGKPIWQCGLCNFTLDRRTPKRKKHETA